jgi:hypothetical protein
VAALLGPVRAGRLTAITHVLEESMRTLLIQAAVAACSLCLLVPLCCWADLLGDRVSERNFRRVEVGMTYRQVEAVLGGGPTGLSLGYSRETWPEEKGWPVMWWGDMYSVIVWFDENGLALGKATSEWSPTKSWESRSAGERALRFLRLENGPPRGMDHEAMYNGMPVRGRLLPFASAALLAAVAMSAVAAWGVRRHRPKRAAGR